MKSFICLTQTALKVTLVKFSSTKANVIEQSLVPPHDKHRNMQSTRTRTMQHQTQHKLQSSERNCLGLTGTTARWRCWRSGTLRHSTGGRGGCRGRHRRSWERGRHRRSWERGRHRRGAAPRDAGVVLLRRPREVAEVAREAGRRHPRAEAPPGGAGGGGGADGGASDGGGGTHAPRSNRDGSTWLHCGRRYHDDAVGRPRRRSDGQHLEARRWRRFRSGVALADGLRCLQRLASKSPDLEAELSDFSRDLLLLIFSGRPRLHFRFRRRPPLVRRSSSADATAEAPAERGPPDSPSPRASSPRLHRSPSSAQVDSVPGGRHHGPLASVRGGAPPDDDREPHRPAARVRCADDGDARIWLGFNAYGSSWNLNNKSRNSSDIYVQN